MRLKGTQLLYLIFLTSILLLVMSASFFPSSNGMIPNYLSPPESSPAAYPFWSDDSYWNLKIPVDAKVHPNSVQMVSWLKSVPGHYSGRPQVKYQSWTQPLYDAYASTPKYTVKIDSGGYLYNVPIPSGSIPSSDSDRWMGIIDWDNNVYNDFWRLRYESGQWKCGAGWKWDLNGSGVGTEGKWTVHGSSTPLLAMLIRPEEIEAGVIKHPLACGLYTPKKTVHVYPPAATTDGRSTATYAIPEGARIQLDPNLNLDNYSLNPTAKIVAKALQDYGAVVFCVSGTFNLYAEHDYSAHWSTHGISWRTVQSSLNTIPARWRIVDYSVFGSNLLRS